MKINSFATAALVLAFTLSASPALADWYKWTDKEGVIHITDDIGKIPENERANAEVYIPSPPGELKGMSPGEAAPAPDFEKFKAGELYGGETLEWWKEKFKKLKEELGATESSYTSKKQYVEIFEGGTRFGQIYGEVELDTYKRYKEDLPGVKAKLDKLKRELDELRRRARLAGVPKVIRE